MNEARKDEQVQHIGQLLLQNDAYADSDWQALALVGTVGDKHKRMTGYRYLADGDVIPSVPKPGWDILEALGELRELMAEKDGRKWTKCLIHLVRPTLAFNIEFEYDDPQRWSMQEKTLTPDAHAERLRPPV